MKERIKQLKGESYFRENLDIFLSREVESCSRSKHTHDFIEISYVSEGSGYHYIDDQVLPIKRGDLFVIPIGTPHVFRPSTPQQDKPLVIYNCIFRIGYLEDWKQYFPVNSEIYKVIFQPYDYSQHWLKYEDIHDKYFPIVDSMYYEYLHKSAGYETILITMLIQLLSLLHRISVKAESPSAIVTDLDSAVHFIKCNYSQNITVKQAAETTYISASHFQRLFKKTTGVTFTQYLQNIRIQKCCELLKSTNQSVQQIANRVGYQDMKFFHNLFRKKTGVSPQQYRRICQAKETGIVISL